MLHILQELSLKVREFPVQLILNVLNDGMKLNVKDDPLMRKLRSMKYPADPDKTFQSRMGKYTMTANTVSNSWSDSESRRPKIK